MPEIDQRCRGNRVALMFYLLEFLFAAYLGFFVYRIFKNGLALNCIAVPILLASALGAVTLFYLSHWITRGVSSNILTRAAVPALFSTITFFTALILLWRK